MSSEVETSQYFDHEQEIELVRLPTLSPLPSRRNRLCRSSHSLHSWTSLGMTRNVSGGASLAIVSDRSACGNRLWPKAGGSFRFYRAAQADGSTAVGTPRYQRSTRARCDGQSATRRIRPPGIAH